MPNPFLTTSPKKKVVGGNPFLTTKKITSGLDLNTSDGLYNLAIQSGLQKKADKILKQKGEDTQKIFSGGFITDVFDALNAIQYGIVGVLKGKSFSEGVKTRQSFSDKDALGEHGLPGVIGGIALDIAVDPLTYIAPWTILKKIPGFMKTGKVITTAVKNTEVGQWLGRKLIYRFGQDPIYKEIAERTIKNIAVGQQNIVDLAKPLTKLDSATQKIIAKARKVGQLQRLSPGLLKKIKPIYDELDRLGAEAVKVGLLPKEIWAKNLGKYLPRMYKTKEIPITGKKILGIIPTKAKKIDLSRFMKRKDIPEDIRTAMGEIMEAGYPTAKGMIQLTAATENAKLFNKVDKIWGRTLQEISAETGEEILKKLPLTSKLGTLSGKYVPKFIYDDIQEIIRIPKEGEKVARKIIGGFKFGKVILNPATHGRNIISNKILNWWKLGMNPLDPRVISTDITALKQIAKGGKWIDEAKTVGYNLNTFAANELKGLLQETKVVQKLRGIPQKLANIYQGEENFAKLSAYIFNRSFKKLGIEDAWKAAESATFNYAQVTPFIRRLRESIFGYPFITFAIKSAPIAVETALKYPRRISSIGKIKNAIENMADIKETAREKAAEPDWVKDGFYIKLPIKDKNGRSAYFDLSYIIPFGDLVSGQFFERTTMRETGLPESAISAQMKRLPFINFIREISRNQDFYGDKIWQDSASQEKQFGDLFRHLTKTYLPPMVADQIPGGHMTQGGRRIKGIRGALTKEEEIRQQRTLMQEILRNVGLKIQPIDADIQESYMEWEKKKALKTLLEEAGITKEFSIPYVPSQ